MSTLFDNTLALPRIGIHDESVLVLVASVILTILVQFVKHYLKDINTVKKMELLASKRKPCNKIVTYTAIQFWKSIAWVVSLLLITNVNIYVIVAHVLADVVFSAFWIVNA